MQSLALQTPPLQSLLFLHWMQRPAWSLQLQLRWSRCEAIFLFSNIYLAKKWILFILPSYALSGFKWCQTFVPGNRSPPPSSNWKWRQCCDCWRRVLQEQWLQGELGKKRESLSYWSILQKTYSAERVDNECLYHPGIPVFHEGMKYWSCCQRKTTEFQVTNLYIFF